MNKLSQARLAELHSLVCFLMDTSDDYTNNHFISPDPDDERTPFGIIYLMQTDNWEVATAAVRLLNEKSELLTFNLENDTDVILAFPKEVEFLCLKEDEVREHFNITFAKLDECRSAGSMYVGDNGAYILQYLDVNEVERTMITAYWKDAYPKFSIHVTNPEGGFDVHIC